MNRFVTWLFASMFAQLVVITAFMVRPMIAQFPMDLPSLSTLLGYVVTLSTGSTPTYAALAGNTAAQTQEAAEAIGTVVAGMLTEYKLTLTKEQLSKLLSAVAAKIAAEAPPTAAAA